MKKGVQKEEFTRPKLLQNAHLLVLGRGGALDGDGLAVEGVNHLEEGGHLRAPEFVLDSRQGEVLLADPADEVVAR